MKVMPALGNEAVVLGALEAGVGFVSTYPGTPASEIGDAFYKIQNSKFKIQNLKFEYSVNEKVALEAAAGAAYSGIRSLVAFKSFGLNVCLDSLVPLNHTELRAGMVIVVADDPGCHSSAQSEQDSRAFFDILFLPTLEPSSPEQAKQFTKLCFEISDKFKKPVILRLTTRVAHQTGPVSLGKAKNPKTKARFIKDRNKFDTMFPHLIEQKRKLFRIISEIEKYLQELRLEKKEINPIYPVEDGDSNGVNMGVVAAGVGFLYFLEAQRMLKLDLPVLKIDSFFPLPRTKIKKFMKGKKRILVIEEILGILEKELNVLAKEIDPGIKIYGEELLEPFGELNPERVFRALEQFIPLEARPLRGIKEKKRCLVKRTPRFCPGCSYWSIFGAVKKAVGTKQVIFTGDIGCYMIGYFPPFEMQDTLLSMGSSIGLAHGINKTTAQKVIAFIGDSTFFHAGIPGVINMINNNSSSLIIVFDNGITAMTGHQPHPGISPAKIKIEKILKTIGIKNLLVINPIKQNLVLIKKIREFLGKKKLAVIICRYPCVQMKRQ